MKRYPLSAMLTSLPMDFTAALSRVKEIGFEWVDVVALADRPASDREALADSGLLVCCASLGRGLPAGHTLDAASTEFRRKAAELVKRQIADTAALGATRAYIVPGADSSADGLLRFADACAVLTEYAAGRMVQLCVEPVPGRALPSAAAALDWLQTSGLDSVSLLLDVGHCLISGEDPATVVRRAGVRLGHVHLDDNDGAGDLHWPLFSGRLTRETLELFLRSLEEVYYDGGLAFEFHPSLPDPARALRDGRMTLEGLM